jgi:4-oxalocrotonate tautomerase
MPEVYVHAIEGRTKEQKRALIKDITGAVVKNFDVTADAVLVEIIESSRDNKANQTYLKFPDQAVWMSLSVG